MKILSGLGRLFCLWVFTSLALGLGTAWAEQGDCFHQVLPSFKELSNLNTLTRNSFKNETVDSLKTELGRIAGLLKQGDSGPTSINPEIQWRVIDLSFLKNPSLSVYAKKIMIRFKDVYPIGNRPYTFGNLGFGKFYEIYHSASDLKTRVWALHQMGHIDVPEAIGFYLCHILNPQTPAPLKQEALFSLKDLADRNQGWGFDLAFIQIRKPILKMIIQGITDPSFGVRDHCLQLLQKLSLDPEDFPPELILCLGSPNKDLDTYVKNKMLGKPYWDLPALFSKGDTSFKLEAIDILEYYGATTLLSYQTLLKAACDPDPGVKSKALQALAKKGVQNPPCPPDSESSWRRPEGTDPHLRFDGHRQTLDNVSTGLDVTRLKPGTRKVTLELSYPPEAVSQITVSSYGNPVSQGLEGHVYCKIPVPNEKRLTAFQNSGFDITLMPKDHSVSEQGAGSKLFSAPGQDKPLTLIAWLTGTLQDGTSYAFPPKKLEFRFISQAWRKLGRKPYDSLARENHKNFKDTRPEYDHGPGVEEIPINLQESLLVLSMNAYTGGGQGYGYVQVFKKNGNSCERILDKEGSYELSHTTVDWGKGKALVVSDDFCSQGDGKGTLYFYHNGDLKNIFTYDASDDAFQSSGSFEAHLETQGGKCYLIRQEQLPQYHWEEHLLNEARPQKAELTWSWLKQKFIQGSFQSGEP